MRQIYFAYPIPPDAVEFALARDSRFCSASSSKAESRSAGLYSAMTGWPGSGGAKAAMMRLGGTRTWCSSPLCVLYAERLLALESMRFSRGIHAEGVVRLARERSGSGGGGGSGGCCCCCSEGREPSKLLRSGRLSRRGFVASVGEEGLGGVVGVEVGGVRLLASGLGRAGAWLPMRARAACMGVDIGVEAPDTIAGERQQSQY